MAAESILTYKKPGFPRTSNTESSYQTVIEYVGPLTTLAAAEPAANDVWGDYDGRVSATQLVPLEGTDQAELTVTTEFRYNGSGGTAGTSSEVSYEVEWVMFQRPMLEHPEFRIGGLGTYELDAFDVADIEAWQNETDPTLKAAFEYNERAVTGSGSTATLSTNAQKYANGVLLGQDTYEDYAPVIRKTTTYVGGLPGTSDAGEKETGPTFSGKPTGYEWRKTADRAVRSAGQTRWDRIEEWTGALKILSDKNSIYW